MTLGAHGAEVSLSRAPSSRLGRAPVLVLGVTLSYALLYTLLFSPVWMDGRVLAPDDGYRYFFAPFQGARSPWTPFLYGGFARYGDPEMMTWYPPSWLSLVGVGYSAFVALSYIIASTACFFLVRRLTGSILAAVVSGTAYGMGGFMISHLPHPSINHAACWLPLVLLGIEELKAGARPGWFMVTLAAAALMTLGGHPQISFYGLLVAGTYAIHAGRTSPLGHRRFLGIAGLALLLGVAAASIQIVPTLAHIGLGSRDSATYSFFTTQSLPPSHLALFLFPYLLGGRNGTGDAFTDYLPPPGEIPSTLWEYQGSVGLLPLALAGIGWVAGRKTRPAGFWLVLTGVGLLLALGGHTPLARATFLVPLYNLFQVPARNLLEVTLGLCVLAGHGVATLEEAEPGRRRRMALGALGGTLGLLLLCWLLFAILAPAGLPALVAQGTSWPPLPWRQASIAVPLLTLALGALALALIARRPDGIARVALVTVTIVDLASFALWADWRHSSPRPARFEPESIVRKYGERARVEHARILSQPHHYFFEDNLPLYWRIPAVSGYSSLYTDDYMQLMDGWERETSSGLDLLATRFLIVTPRNLQHPVADARESTGHGHNLDLVLGGPCPEAPRVARTRIRWPGVSATHVGQVSNLYGATDLADGAPVVAVTLETDEGRIPLSLVVGRDTAEHAWDRPDVRPVVRHAKPRVFRSFPNQEEGRPYVSHAYTSVQPLPGRTRVKAVELRWIGPARCSLGSRLHHLTLFDEYERKTYMFLGPLREGGSHWRLREKTAEGMVFENPRALPRGWVVGDVRRLERASILEAIRGGRLPGGEPFDPRRTALVETPVTFRKGAPDDGRASVEVLAVTPTELRLRASTTAPGFLVVSEPYHHAWRAWVGATETPVLKTQGYLRGLMLPPGTHEIKMRFLPRDLAWGVAGSATALLAALAVVFGLRRRASRPAGGGGAA